MSTLDKKIRHRQDYFNRNIYVSTNRFFIDYCKNLIEPILKQFTTIMQMSYDIIFFKKNALEQNLPHTHGNCMFIPYEYFINLPQCNSDCVCVAGQLHSVELTSKQLVAHSLRWMCRATKMQQTSEDRKRKKTKEKRLAPPTCAYIANFSERRPLARNRFVAHLTGFMSPKTLQPNQSPFFSPVIEPNNSDTARERSKRVLWRIQISQLVQANRLPCARPASSHSAVSYWI